jgi:hypothetical protein
MQEESREKAQEDFFSWLATKEWHEVRTSLSEVYGSEHDKGDRSQIATGSKRVRLRDQIALGTATLQEASALEGGREFVRPYRRSPCGGELEGLREHCRLIAPSP